MKKLVFGIILGMLFLGLISFAITENNLSNNQNVQAQNKQALGELKKEIRESLRQGEDVQIRVADRDITIRATANERRIQLRARNITAHTEMNLTEEDDNITGRGKILRAALSNGRYALVKIMPDSASQVALQRLRLKVCNESNNCTIQLKETGQGNQTRAVYELRAERRARILGLFRARMRVQSQIDAENGGVIQAKKPWWAFLATEPEE